MEALTPTSCVCDCSWSWVIVDVIWNEVILHEGEALIQWPKSSWEKDEGYWHTETQMDVGMGTEIVIMLPQAGELAARSYWQPPETGKKPGRAPPRSFQRKHHPLTLDFKLPASGTTWELVFVVLRHQLSGNFFTAALGNQFLEKSAH